MSDTIQDGIYPLTITSDRYSGVYSGNTIVCGKGNTVEEAIGDLYIKLRKGAKR